MTENLITIIEDLARETGKLSFGRPVTHVYNPLIYARQPYAQYLNRYGAARQEIILVGMNPGPWGMVQTGIPFGDVVMVRDWLGIEGKVGRPLHEHPRRPVEGFACRRREVSGRRLWGWARDRFGKPEVFFRRFFVANYCPLCFLEESGRNRTPDKLPRKEREKLLAVCDHALHRIVSLKRPKYVIGIGKFAGRRVAEALRDMPVTPGSVSHPSPANPRANRGWDKLVAKELADIGVVV